MAAYDYYQQSGRQPGFPPSYDHASPSPDPFGTAPSAQGYPGATASPAPSAGPDHDPYYARYSQNSLASDSGAYPVAGRRDDSDQYAENIPLANSRSDWMHQPTNYPPSPEAQQNMDPSARGRRRRKGFFKKKLAWVTYLFTTAQVIVFIIELVRNGKIP